MRRPTPLIGGAAASVLATCAPAAAAPIRSHFVGFSGGLLMSVIAFSIVFIIIAGLMIMMMLLKSFAGSIDGSKAPAKPAAPAAPAPAPTQAPAIAAAPASPAPDDELETIAAITAAIAAMIDGPAHIASITPARTAEGHHRPYAGATAWRMAGILGNTGGLGD